MTLVFLFWGGGVAWVVPTPFMYFAALPSSAVRSMVCTRSLVSSPSPPLTRIGLRPSCVVCVPFFDRSGPSAFWCSPSISSPSRLPFLCRAWRRLALFFLVRFDPPGRSAQSAMYPGPPCPFFRGRLLPRLASPLRIWLQCSQTAQVPVVPPPFSKNPIKTGFLWRPFALWYLSSLTRCVRLVLCVCGPPSPVRPFS